MNDKVSFFGCEMFLNFRHIHIFFFSCYVFCIGFLKTPQSLILRVAVGTAWLALC